jgi:glycosidase
MKRLSILISGFVVLCSVPAAAQRGDSTWLAHPAIYELFVRDFSPAGDFQGVTAGLDKVQATGANVVWLMPIYPIGKENRKGTLGSPYSVMDYKGINPDFGTAADFRALVSAAHKRNLKVILDFVPNHTSFDNAWISSHPDYYTHDASGKISVALNNDGTATDWTDVADLNYSNPETRQAVIADMRYWIDKFNVDGFRMDAAGMVPDDFWPEANKQLRAAKPVLLLAEWGEPKMHNFGFDLTYAWDAYGGLKDVWRKNASASQWLQHQVDDVNALPNHGRRLRFTTNHDETAWDKPPRDIFGGSAGARAAFVAMTLLPGTPLLYNGQEVEANQKLPLFEKQTVAWNQPFAQTTRAFYSKVIRIARSNKAFAGNDVVAVSTNADNDVIAYQRGNAVVLVNTRNHPVSVTASGATLSKRRDLLSGNLQTTDEVSLPRYGAVVLQAAR